MPTSDRLFERLKGKKIAFVGTGVSHNDLIMMFLAHGMDVTVCDRKFREQLGSLADLVDYRGQPCGRLRRGRRKAFARKQLS